MHREHTMTRRGRSDARDTAVATVHCVDVALLEASSGPGVLTYGVPDHLADAVRPGAAVTVPLGPEARRAVSGGRCCPHGPGLGPSRRQSPPAVTFMT